MQGLTLEKPEMVPFRLTQNIIDAFGVSGIEGVFQHVAEITLQVGPVPPFEILLAKPLHVILESV